MINQEKHHIFNLIVLDESGSMQSIKAPTINGFNELVQTIKAVEEEHPEQLHLISLLTFNGRGVKTLLTTASVSALMPLEEERYQPASSTPLYDAMGEGLTELRSIVTKYQKHNVLVSILTDGEENSSKEYNGAAIKALVSELQELGWTFTYIGANHDVESFAKSIAIKNTMRFQATQAGTQQMFSKEKMARKRYSKRISNQEDVSGSDYYENN